jgi:hypothetical protein
MDRVEQIFFCSTLFLHEFSANDSKLIAVMIIKVIQTHQIIAGVMIQTFDFRQKFS